MRSRRVGTGKQARQDCEDVVLRRGVRGSVLNANEITMNVRSTYTGIVGNKPPDGTVAGSIDEAYQLCQVRCLPTQWSLP